MGPSRLAFGDYDIDPALTGVGFATIVPERSKSPIKAGGRFDPGPHRSVHLRGGLHRQCQWRLARVRQRCFSRPIQSLRGFRLRRTQLGRIGAVLAEVLIQSAKRLVEGRVFLAKTEPGEMHGAVPAHVESADRDAGDPSLNRDMSAELFIGTGEP